MFVTQKNGGGNVAKPMHVGHLRPANIEETLKRITRFMENQVNVIFIKK